MEEFAVDAEVEGLGALHLDESSLAVFHEFVDVFAVDVLAGGVGADEGGEA